jgi:propanol-preferring alcohol dehydrogenase
VLIRVLACAVCRTDLHVAEGDLPPHRSPVVPGHEVVGEVVDLGAGVEGYTRGERVGVAWLRHTCGECGYCLRGAENLCPRSRYTGWDADGGFAEYTVAPADFVYRLPSGYTDVEVAPLLCAGIIGFRAYRFTGLSGAPEDGPGANAEGSGATVRRLGLYGFGASAHLAAQVAIAQGVRVHVLTRSVAARELALALGAASAGAATDRPPEPLDAAILFAPAGELVPEALTRLDRGGTLVVAGIYLSEIPPMSYADHLFLERGIRSVTANTRADGQEFFEVAARHRLRVTTSPYSLDRADQALADLAADRVNGAAVLVP